MKINYKKGTVGVGDIVEYEGQPCLVVVDSLEPMFSVVLVRLEGAESIARFESAQGLSRNSETRLLIRHADIVISDARAGE